jgi:hypothetical protein
MIAKKDVTITAQDRKQPLDQAKWIVLTVRGFTTEEDALHFGARLRDALQLAALSSRLGVDVGEGKPTGWVREEFARAMGLIKEHERIAPNIHGLAILPDDDNTRFPIVDAQGTVTANPEHFTSALTEAGENEGLGAAANGVNLLNLALMTSEPLAQMVLALSAVEELGQSEKWGEAQLRLIKQLADIANISADVNAEERMEVVKAIETGLFRLSLRQGVMRLLARLDLNQLRKGWDRLYGIRSGIFHGTARLTAPELNQAAQDTITLCGQIILVLVTKEGAKVPSISTTHYPTVPAGIQP